MFEKKPTQTATIHVMMMSDEKDFVTNRAKELGKSISAYIRDLVAADYHNSKKQEKET